MHSRKERQKQVRGAHLWLFNWIWCEKFWIMAALRQISECTSHTQMQLKCKMDGHHWYAAFSWNLSKVRVLLAHHSLIPIDVLFSLSIHTLFHDLRYYFDLLYAWCGRCVCVCVYIEKKEKTISFVCVSRIAHTRSTFTTACYSSSSHTFIRPLIIQLQAIPNILILRARCFVCLRICVRVRWCFFFHFL